LIAPPLTEQELIARAEALSGKTLGYIFEQSRAIHEDSGDIPDQLRTARSALKNVLTRTKVSARAGCPLLKSRTSSSKKLQYPSPYHKGAIGQAFEKILGADAGNAPIPDFSNLNIELKTLPINTCGKPAESTFISSITLTDIAKETWKTSSVYRKLQRILWIPVESAASIPLVERRVGQPFLWTPDAQQENWLKSDWCELTNRIVLGQLETISAKDGYYLQIRPKAANGQSLSWGINEQGIKIKTLPRGFYLRARFTALLLK